MAKTVIVGRVSIKVWPDTSGFRRQLRDEVKAASADEAVEVPVDFSLTQMKKALAERVRELNAEVKTLPGVSVKIPAIVEATTETYSSLRRVISELQLAAKADKIELKTDVQGGKAPETTSRIKLIADPHALDRIVERMQKHRKIPTLRIPTIPEADPKKFEDMRLQMMSHFNRNPIDTVVRAVIQLKHDKDYGKELYQRFIVRPALDMQAMVLAKKRLAEEFIGKRVDALVRPITRLADIAAVKAKLAAAFAGREGKLFIKPAIDTAHVVREIANVKAEVAKSKLRMKIEPYVDAARTRLELAKAGIQRRVQMAVAPVLDQVALAKAAAKLKVLTAKQDVKWYARMVVDETKLRLTKMRIQAEPLMQKLYPIIDKTRFIAQQAKLTAMWKAYTARKTWQIDIQPRVKQAAAVAQALLTRAKMAAILNGRDLLIGVKIASRAVVSAVTKAAAVAKTVARTAFRAVTFPVRAVVNSKALVMARMKIQTALSRATGFVARIGLQVIPATLAAASLKLKGWAIRAAKYAQVKVKAVLDNKALAATMAGLARLTGARMVAKKLEIVGDLADLDLALPKIFAISHAVGAVATIGISAAGSMLSLARSLVELAAGAVALPGIFVSMGVSMASAVIALKDMNKQVPAFKSGMKQLTAANNTAFWNEARKGISDLVTNWMPKLTAGMGLVGAANGRVFSALALNLQKIVTSRLDTWFKAVALGLDNFVKAGGSTGLANIIRGFGDLGAIYFPQVWKWFGQIIGQFGTWISGAVKSGEAMRWVERAKERVAELWNVIKGAAGIFDGLSKAASNAGGTTLKVFGDMMLRISEYINRVDVQQTLTNVFIGAKQAVDDFVRLAGPGLEKFFTALGRLLPVVMPLVGQTLGILVDALGTALADPNLGKGVLDLFAGLQRAVGILAPGIKLMGIGLGILATVVGQVAEALAPVVEVLLVSFVNGAGGLLRAIGPVVQMLAGGFVRVLQVIVPKLDDLMQVIGDVAIQIAGPLGDAIGNLAPMFDVVFGMIVGALQDVLPRLGNLIGAVLPMVVKLIQFVGPFLGAAITGAIYTIGGLADAFTLGVQGIGVFGEAVQALARGDLNAIPGIIQRAGESFAKIPGAIQEAAAKAGQASTQIPQAVQTSMDSANANMSTGMSGLASSTTVGMAGVRTAFSGPMNDLVMDAATGANNVNENVSTQWGVLKTNTGLAFSGMSADVSEEMAAIYEAAGINAVATESSISSSWATAKGKTASAFSGMDADVERSMSSISSKTSSKSNSSAQSVMDAWSKAKGSTDTNWSSMAGTVDSKSSKAQQATQAAMRNAQAATQNSMIQQQHATIAAWAAMYSAIDAKANSTIDRVNTMLDRIEGTMQASRGDMRSSGSSIIESFADGIRAAANDPIGAARSVLSRVRAFFPNSPAKVGPFSGQGWVSFSGQAVSRDFAKGIKREATAARDAALDMANETRSALDGATTSSSSGLRALVAGGGGAASGGDIFNLELNVSVDDVTKIPDLVSWTKGQRQRFRQQTGGII